MSKLNENQKRIIEEITNEFLSMNEKQASESKLIDLDFLSEAKKEWKEKVLMLEKKNECLLQKAKDECLIAWGKLRDELEGIADVKVRYDNYAGYILIEKKGRDAFRITYEAPLKLYVHNDTLGDNFRYADKFTVRGYVSGNHSIDCDSTEEFFSNEYVKNRLYKLLK
jgi:hypothetical protein